MKMNLRRVITGAAALVITFPGSRSDSRHAAVATAPAWERDGNSLGSRTLFDASGNVITGGTNIGHLFDYAEASSPDTAGGTKATLIFGLPTPGEDPGLWPSGQASTSVLTPPTAAGTPSSLMNARKSSRQARASERTHELLRR